MIWVITERIYDDDGRHEAFKALMEGDRDPEDVLFSWRCTIGAQMSEWRSKNPLPKSVAFPNKNTTEEGYVAWARGEAARKDHRARESKFGQELHGRLGKDPIDALLKAGFKEVASRVHSV